MSKNNNPADRNNLNHFEQRKRAKHITGEGEDGKDFADVLKEMHPVPTQAAKWRRKEMREIDSSKEALCFSWIDIGMYEGEPLLVNPQANQPVPGSSIRPCPIIRLCGVTREGHSVMMHVHGFSPYFYAECPVNFKEQDCELVRKSLNDALTMNAPAGSPAKVLGVDVKKNLMSLYGYRFDQKSDFLVIYLAMPSDVAKARGILAEGLNISGYPYTNYQTYESNVPYTLRFMIDKDIVGCNWLELPAGSYSIRSDEHRKMSR